MRLALKSDKCRLFWWNESRFFLLLLRLLLKIRIDQRSVCDPALKEHVSDHRRKARRLVAEKFEIWNYKEIESNHESSPASTNCCVSIRWTRKKNRFMRVKLTIINNDHHLPSYCSNRPAVTPLIVQTCLLCFVYQRKK